MLYQNKEKHRVKPSAIKRSAILLQLFFLKVINDRKTYLLFLIGFLPLLSVIARPVSDIDIDLYIGLVFSRGERTISFYSFILLPLITLILGISAVADEKENKTISQILAKPIHRQEFVIAKWLVATITGIAIICILNAITLSTVGILAGDLGLIFDNLNLFLAISIFLSIYTVTYVSIFVLLGTVIEKNALVIGLVIAYFEAFFSQFIFGLAAGSNRTPYSITNNLYYIASEYLLPDHINASITNFEPWMSVAVIAGIVILSITGAMVIIRRIDIK
ncbi:MAG: ABC transporter permease subunit [Candidatus Hodarchaeales archaeon]